MTGLRRSTWFLWRWSVAVVTCLAAFAGTWWAWEALRLPPAGADRLGVALAAGAAVSAAMGGPLFWWAAREKPPLRKRGKGDLREVADRLATSVKAQWDYEMERRRVFNPYALSVQWAAAEPALFTPWSVLVEQAAGSPGESAETAATWAAGPDELAGEGKNLANVLSRVPTRRLVVLGEPGAGKTILLVRLVLELLTPKRRKDGEAVPILLPVGSWNPAIDDLHSWIVHWLATDPAGLARLTPDAPGTARELLEAGLILPVLDGFDEIPDEVRGSAIAKINEALKPCPGLILASRTEAYRTAVCGDGDTRILLAGAAGIELRSLDSGAVARYLVAAADSQAVAERWKPVIATFSAGHPPPVAQALTTPLMVTLARAIYNPRDNEGTEAIQHQPAELLNYALFSTRTAVENYMFDKFIWAAYRPHPDPSHPSRRYPWDYEQAKRWLVSWPATSRTGRTARQISHGGSCEEPRQGTSFLRFSPSRWLLLPQRDTRLWDSVSG